MKLELGSGERPTHGYLHQDVIQLNTPLDFVCNAWQIPMEKESIEEVIAIAVMEHLRYEDFRKTLKCVYDILVPGGVFYFDVPDLYVWSGYLFFILHGNKESVPFSKEDIYKTMWGWQRWPGDEHKSMWIKEDLYKELKDAGFKVTDGLEDIKLRVKRDRFKPEYVKDNAHIFIKAMK